MLRKNQKLLSGYVFEPKAKDSPGMRELVNVVDLQGWTHLFEWPVPYLHE